MNKAEYHEYLLSPKWKSRARWARERANDRCERCLREAPRLEVHHLTYDRVGHEDMEDLIALCPYCHRKEHGIKPTADDIKASGIRRIATIQKRKSRGIGMLLSVMSDPEVQWMILELKATLAQRRPTMDFLSLEIQSHDIDAT